MDDIAIVQANFYQRGGAERVSEQMARALDAPLYVGFYDSSVLTEEDIDYRPVFTSKPQKLIQKSNLLASAYNWWYWQDANELYEYDVLIFSGNETSWYVPPEDQTIIQYMHHLPHQSYDYYQRDVDSIVEKLYTYTIRQSIHHTLPYRDYWISNSSVTSEKMHKYWNIDPDVEISPSIDFTDYTISDENRDSYYLIVSRLEDRKRISSVFSAFETNQDLQLKIAGDGSNYSQLQNEAPDNVELLGYVSESKKQKLMQNCRAFIMPTLKEDFGITTVEAMACGTPVIGVNEGFTKELISTSETGICYDRGEFMDALLQMENAYKSFEPEEIRKYVRIYSHEEFADQISDFVMNIS